MLDMDETAKLGPGHDPLPLASDVLRRRKSMAFSNPCGAENRVAIDATEDAPWNGICYLIVRKKLKIPFAKYKSYRSTGFFINPTTVVTAGHCVFSKGMKTGSIQIIPGRDEDNWPLGSIMAREYRIPNEWRKNGNESFDYGVVKLDTPFDGQSPYNFALANLDRAVLESTTAHTAGYPSDMDRSFRLHHNEGPIDSVASQRLGYFLDTWTGASGSPVWIERDGKREVVGIHNYGHCPNKATRVNSRVLNDLQEWSAP